MKKYNVYANLTSKERAVLAVECLAYGELREPQTIANSFEHGDAEFIEHGRALTNLGLMYGMRYWQTRWAILAADDPAQHITQIASLHEALRTVCIKLGVEIGAIQQIANCRGEPVIGNADPKLTKHFTETFMSLFL